MAYFAPFISSSGFHIPTYTDILNDLIAQMQLIYPTAYLVNPDGSWANDSADFQHLAIFALKVYDCFNTAQLVYTNRSPVSAIGTGLDLIVKLNGIQRNIASYSTCYVTVYGTPYAPITNGICQDTSGYYWDLPSPLVIGAEGSFTVVAVCETLGAISAPIGTINIIATPQAGWISVTNNEPAVLGNFVETDSALRTRQAVSTALPSETRLAGTISAIAALSGVTRYLVYDNPTGTTSDGSTIYGGGASTPGLVLLPAGLPGHSVICMVEGDTDANVANAIYLNKGPGCGTFGTDIIDVTDSTYGTIVPISFFRPIYMPIAVSLDITRKYSYNSSTTIAIQTAIVNYINSLSFGETITISALIGTALSITPNLANPEFSVNVATAKAGPCLGGANSAVLIGSSGLNLGTANTAVASNSFTYWLGGQSLSANAANTTLTANNTIPQNKWGCYLFSINANGITCTAGANNSTGYASEADSIANVPTIPTNQAAMGYITVSSSVGTFTANSTALNANGITTNYYSMGMTNSDVIISYYTLSQGYSGIPVNVNWRGPYSNSTAYLIGDGVSYPDGNLYQAILNTTGNVPSSNSTYWSVVSGIIGNVFLNVS